MISFRVFSSLAFSAVTVFLSILNLGIEEGTFQTSLLLERVALGWQEITRTILSPLNIILIDGWQYDDTELDSLSLIVFITIPFAANFWNIARIFSLYAAIYIAFYVIIFGLDNGPIEERGLNETFNIFGRIFSVLMIYTLYTFFWLRGRYLDPEVKSIHILLALAKSWASPLICGVVFLTLYLSGSIDIIGFIFRPS